LLGCYQLLLLPKANSLTKGVVLSSKATTKNSFRVVQILKQIYPYFQLLFSHKLPTYHRLHTYQFISFSPPPSRLTHPGRWHATGSPPECSARPRRRMGALRRGLAGAREPTATTTPAGGSGSARSTRQHDSAAPPPSQSRTAPTLAIPAISPTFDEHDPPAASSLPLLR
jgi:hypothetical protein